MRNRNKYLLSIFFSLILKSSIAQNIKEVVISNSGECNIITENDFKNDRIRFNGFHIYFYDTLCTKIKATFYMKDLLITGKVRSFDINGNLISLENYIDGIQNGFFFFWNSKGELIRKEFWKRGKLIRKFNVLN